MDKKEIEKLYSVKVINVWVENGNIIFLLANGIRLKYEQN